MRSSSVSACCSATTRTRSERSRRLGERRDDARQCRFGPIEHELCLQPDHAVAEASELPITSTKSLLSDYALALAERDEPALPIIVTLSPCGSEKTLAFMKWLGISFPRWLENELRFAADPLTISVDLCEAIFAEVWEYARSKRIPLGVNVESVSIRKAEIDASVELFRRLRRRMT